METITKRRSRFIDYQPTGQRFEFTANDLAILDLFQDYRYLPSTYIIALTGRDPITIRARLTVLRKQFGFIRCPSASWATSKALHRPAVYCLTPKGEGKLQRHGLWRGIPKTGGSFEHELGVDMFHASLAIGVRRYPTLSLRSAEDILALAPEATRRSATPFDIPVRFTFSPIKGSPVTVDTVVQHDGSPFGIRFERDGKLKHILCPGIELDCNTEGLTSSTHKRVSIDRHLSGTLELLRSEGYKRRYGFPKAFVPYVALGESHMYSIMDRLRHVTKGQGSDRIIFTCMPDYTSFDTFPLADGAMLNRPYKRINYPDLNMLKELGVE